MDYIRIEAEAGGAGQRIYPNDIRDNRRCDGREGEWHERKESTSETLNRLCGEQTKSGAADHIRLKGKKELAAAEMSPLL